MESGRVTEIEEMVAEYKRSELNEIAFGLDLDPRKFRDKRTIADAILETRKLIAAMLDDVIPETEVVETMAELPAVEEVKVEMVEVSENSVEPEINVIEEKVAEVYTGVRKLMKENEAAVAEFNTGAQEQMKENEAAVAAFVPKVQEQMKENEAAVAAFVPKVQEQMKENEAAVAEFVPKVHELMKENEDFAIQFYG